MTTTIYDVQVATAISDWESILDAPAEPEAACERCGRPLTSKERVADGMGTWCRNHQPHRRRLRFMGYDHSGASLFEIYSLTRGGTDHKHSVRIHFEHGEFFCSCEHFQFRHATCKHIARACAWERRRRNDL